MARMIVLKRELRYPRGREAKTYQRGESFEALDKDVKILRQARIADVAPPVAPLGHVASTSAPAAYSRADLGEADTGEDADAAEGAEAPTRRGGYRTRRLKAED